jgi:hypothetical protein
VIDRLVQNGEVISLTSDNHRLKDRDQATSEGPFSVDVDSDPAEAVCAGCAHRKARVLRPSAIAIGYDRAGAEGAKAASTAGSM